MTLSFSHPSKRELLQYLPEGLFLEDEDGKILDVNPQACELLGYEREELLNRPATIIVAQDKGFFTLEQIDEAMNPGAGR
ncbi:MAG: PAS domain-containing protein [Candidatus Acetothermia bacterium]